MEKFIEMVKDHPIPIAIGVVVLLLLMRGGSKTSSSGSSALAYQSQQLSVQSNTQIAGINSATTLGLGAQSVEKFRIAASDAQARTSVAANVVSSMMGATLQRDLADSASTNKVILATFARAANNDTIAGDLEKQKLVINGGIRMNADNLNAQILRNNDDNNFKLNEIGAKTQGNLATIAAQTLGSVSVIGAIGNQAQIMADKNNAFTASTLPTLLQSRENLARITGQNAIQIAQVNTQADNTRAQGEKNASDWGIVTNFVGSIGKIFGF